MHLPHLRRAHAQIDTDDAMADEVEPLSEEERAAMCRLIAESMPVQRADEHERLEGDGLAARLSRADAAG
jgi:hypothetical protein